MLNSIKTRVFGAIMTNEKGKSESPFVSYGDIEIDKKVGEGIKAFALRSYEEAVEQFGDACRLYSEKNDGEEDPELLFHYGKALYRVAVEQSEVLGEKAQKKKEETPKDSDTRDEGDDTKAEGEEDEGEEAKDEGDVDKDKEGDKEGEEEEQSDFEVAWEILDLTRTLFSAKLENNPEDVTIKKKLAEVYDILGEVSLESENFQQAAEDLAQCLEIRSQVYEESHPLVSESHFKLSLALEFDFSTAANKQKAVEHMEKALESVKQRIAKSGQEDPDLINDLETRLEDLRASEAQVNAVNQEKVQALDGLVGQEASSVLKTQLLEAVSNANDISGLVRKKKPTPASTSTTSASGTSTPSKRTNTDDSTPTKKAKHE
ncbi:hypothetical protein TRVA0_013S03048 [Trichomonascus vanleenenianus]|uniref:SHNi-TPR domain-containing protein n=1 Tax=Trichomonascus vanleenenianus TaxID=2268995 RepID=UPI003ECA905B